MRFVGTSDKVATLRGSRLSISTIGRAGPKTLRSVAADGRVSGFDVEADGAWAVLRAERCTVVDLHRMSTVVLPASCTEDESVSGPRGGRLAVARDSTVGSAPDEALISIWSLRTVSLVGEFKVPDSDPEIALNQNKESSYPTPVMTMSGLWMLNTMWADCILGQLLRRISHGVLTMDPW